MERKATPLKEKVKAIAKSKKLTLKDIYEHLGISQVAFDKCFYSKNIEYSKRIHDIAEFLGVQVGELTGNQKEEQKVIGNQVNEGGSLYSQTDSGSNLLPDEKTLLQVLKTENVLLKEIISKQEKEIEFLRGQLVK